jgi:hypothetical protein
MYINFVVELVGVQFQTLIQNIISKVLYTESLKKMTKKEGIKEIDVFDM